MSENWGEHMVRFVERAAPEARTQTEQRIGVATGLAWFGFISLSIASIGVSALAAKQNERGGSGRSGRADAGAVWNHGFERRRRVTRLCADARVDWRPG